MKRRDDDYVGRKAMDMQMPRKRKCGRPKRRYFDVVKEAMQQIGVREEKVFGCDEGGHAGGRSEGR